ncbi:protein of unknown function [Nitrospira japonica]|uniref:Uncharacterized protein n=1 Tax=Nitrospira japonica TaxID=1325564 RepID=A0A1W1I850_9BACT|nr:protein of unknown function [Nitrospira japonica]
MSEKSRHCGGFASIYTVLIFSVLVCSPSPATGTDLPIQGGPGGTLFRAECPKGAYLTGLAGRAGKWIDQLAPICSPLETVKRTFGAPQTMGSHGSSSGGSPRTASCALGGAIAGLDFDNTIGEGGLPDHKFVSRLYAYCQGIIPNTLNSFFIFSPGGEGGGQFVPYGSDSFCPTGLVAVGFHGRAGLFVDALGLICQPLIKPGTAQTDIQKMTQAFPNAPAILSPKPNGFIIKGNGVFRIAPSQFLSGTDAEIELKWLNPSANLRQQNVQTVYTYRAPMSVIAGPKGVDAPQIYLAPGTWEIRVRIVVPKAGDWSAPVRFTYYLQHPSFGTPTQDAQNQDLQFGIGGQQKNMNQATGVYRPQSTPQQGMGNTSVIRPRGVDDGETKEDRPSAEPAETEKRP